MKAHRIVRRSAPEIDDAFARTQGFADAASLRQAIMAAALQRKEAQARDAFADALVRQVLDGMEVQVPDSMVESQLTGLLQELESRGLLQAQRTAGRTVTADDTALQALRRRRAGTLAAEFLHQMQALGLTEAEIETLLRETAQQAPKKE